ncbi:MAG: NTP transferase domain-containing protein [Phycisphaerales bacterium]|nr:NTP transferase domain-containing protein [Phycisphaerales bacterium]
MGTGDSNTMSGSCSAIILAAGKGTRMRSDLPKVVHPVGGRAMVCAVVDACLEAGCSKIVVVVGYKQELVREALASYGSKVQFAVQGEQLGTGHAVQCAVENFAGERATRGHDVFVLCGDGPLIRSETLGKLMACHRAARAAATLATSVIDDPTGYGRIVRGPDGRFVAIVEHKDCTTAQLTLREVNPSYYCFDASLLFSALARVGRNERSGEYYLTDVPKLLLADGARVEVIDAVPPEDILSINTPEELSRVDGIYRARGGRAGSGLHQHQSGAGLSAPQASSKHGNA